jgi:PAS domain S-box-containing protein
MGKPTILCVDDEMLVLSSLRDFLNQVLGDDYVIEIAASGEEALEVISELAQSQSELPLIITDQLMPGLKGDELLAEIHQNYPKTLKVMLTGQATPEAVGNAVNTANLYRYIAKPWSDTLLMGVVQDALKNYFQDKALNEVNIILEQINSELEQKIASRTADLQYQLALEQLVATISTEFINLSYSEVDTGVQAALKRLGEFAQADHCALFQTTNDKTTLICSHAWSAPNAALPDLSIHDLPELSQRLQQFEVLNMPRLGEFESAPTTAPIALQSFLCVPIGFQKSLFGCLSLATVHHPREWSADLIKILRTIGEIIAETIHGRNTEAALRESEERFHRAFDNAPIGMALLDLDGQFLQVNQALCEIMGYTETQMLVCSFQDLIHPDQLPVTSINLQKLLSGPGYACQLEQQWIHHQGHPIWVLLSISLIKDQTGQPLSFVCQIQDISERCMIDRMKDEFVSVVSHELRTPLTAICGALGLLQTGKYDEDPNKFRHLLSIALSNSDRLVRLVEDILSLERLESGKVQLVIEPCNVQELISQAVEAIQPIAQQAAIMLSVQAISTVVWAAANAIVQTLINLLSNAIKFSPEGSTICLSAELKKPDCLAQPQLPTPVSTSYVLFTITDQGRGIPADKLEIIFERFQQVDASDSRQKGGTGLGLAICKSIVQQHNGQIWAESQGSQGSTFYFTLPVAEPEP